MGMYGIIYKITNKINGKVYIGQTVQKLSTRMYQHKTEKSNSIITNAIKKYGFDNFEVKIIAACYDKESLNQTEMQLIKSKNTQKPNGYNIESGGNSSPVAESTKLLISKANKGRKHKPRTAKQCANTSRYGKTYYHKSKTKRIRLSARKKIEGIHINTGEKIYFDSTLEAQKLGGFHRGKISECANGKRQIHKYYMWRYI